MHSVGTGWERNLPGYCSLPGVYPVPGWRREVPRVRPQPGDARALPPSARGYARGREATRSFDPDDPLGPARAYLTQEVNRRLRGHVHLTLGSFQDSPIRFFPDSLLAAIYLRFALELAGRSARERECEFCHVPFPVGRRDQRFCSKSCRENAGYHRRREEKTASSATSGRSAVDEVSVSRPE